MSKKKMNAVAAERLFGVVVLLLLVGLVADFIFVTNFLKSEAVKTETLRAQSDATDNDIAKLKSADEWLSENEDVVKRTSAVVAESRLYQYQNQIIEDFNGYGSQAGVPISGYSFMAAANAASPGAPTTATPPPPSNSGGSAPGASPTPAVPPTSSVGVAATTSKAPTGVNSITVTVTFGDKVNYQNFLTFLRLLEKNVTRMQVTDLSLNPDAKEPQTVTNPNITVIVYTR